MDVRAVLGILGLVATVFSTLWATGGWSALRRRSIQQELDLAKELPTESATRKRLIAHAEEEIKIYLYRTREQPIRWAQPAGLFVPVFIITAAIAGAFPDPNVVVMVVIEGLFVAAVVFVYAAYLRCGWVWWSRRRHKALLHAAQDALRKGPQRERSAGRRPSIRASSASASMASRGLANRSPCASSQPLPTGGRRGG